MEYLHEYLYVRAQSPKWPATLSSVGLSAGGGGVCSVFGSEGQHEGRPRPRGLWSELVNRLAKTENREGKEEAISNGGSRKKPCLPLSVLPLSLCRCNDA